MPHRPWIAKLKLWGATDASLRSLMENFNVFELDLSGCDGITDVSMLGGVHTLNLRECEGITDVSALGGVQTLNLVECKGITDVSALGGVVNLTLQNGRTRSGRR